MNLGWKLASTIGGDAPAGLIDSYASERHPMGAQILDWSRAQVAIMRPVRSSRALEAILRDLIDTRDGATYFAERVWGVSVRYDLGGSHALSGRSAPDFELVDGTRLGELMRDGKGLLLDFDGSQPLGALASRWSRRITYVASDVQDRRSEAILGNEGRPRSLDCFVAIARQKTGVFRRPMAPRNDDSVRTQRPSSPSRRAPESRQAGIFPG
jgi:hypothetical protein